MNPVLLRVEGVNDPIVANASSETVRSFQPMMWKRFEAQSDFIDFRSHACTQSGWQLEENGIETLVVNLSRCAHEPSGSRTRALFPLAMSRSDCRMELSNSGVNCSSSSITSSNHSRICRSSSCDSLRSSDSICSTLLTPARWNELSATSSATRLNQAASSARAGLSSRE